MHHTSSEQTLWNRYLSGVVLSKPTHAFVLRLVCCTGESTHVVATNVVGQCCEYIHSNVPGCQGGTSQEMCDGESQQCWNFE